MWLLSLYREMYGGCDMINPVVLLNKKIDASEMAYGQRVKPKSMKIDEKSGWVSGEFAGDVKAKVNMKTGEFECNCESNKRTYCRHIVGLLLNFDETKYPELVSEFEKVIPPWLSVKDVPTGVSSIDKLMYGGFKRGKVTLLVGSSKSGKTTLMLQTAVNLAMRQGLKTFYIDTENMFAENDDVLRGSLRIFKRELYPDLDPDTFDYIKIAKGTDTSHIKKLINVNIDMQQSGRKVQVNVSKWAMRTSSLYNELKSGEYGLVVLDSFSALIKNMGSLATTANLPARASVIEAIWYRFEEMAKDLNVAVVFISHESYDKIRIKLKDIVTSTVTDDTFFAWGGQSLLYLVKYMYYMSSVSEKDFPFVKDVKNKHELRIIARRLYPYAPKIESVYVRNRMGVGFIDWQL